MLNLNTDPRSAKRSPDSLESTPPTSHNEGPPASKRTRTEDYPISSPVDLGAMGLGTPRSIPLSTPCFITTLSTSIISMVTKPAVSYTT